MQIQHISMIMTMVIWEKPDRVEQYCSKALEYFVRYILMRDLTLAQRVLAEEVRFFSKKARDDIGKLNMQGMAKKS